MIGTDFALGFGSGFVSSLAASGAVAASRHILGRRALAQILNFPRDERIVFVFPSRKDDPGFRGLLEDLRVAFEDMLAVNYLQRAFSIAGWKESSHDIREHKRFRAHDAHDAAKNIVLICSPRSNPLTREYLDKINESTGLNWTFEEGKTRDEFVIRTGDGVWSSATWEQDKAIRGEGREIGDGPLDDIAMVVKAQNPYNPDAKVLIIAGIRGIGTWGAAKFIRQKPERLAKKSGGKNFAMLLKVRYHNYGIESVTETDVFRTL